MNNYLKNYILIGPAYPFRGGISNTNHELILEIQKKRKNSLIITFKKLYPRLIFPGKNQYSDEKKPTQINIERHLSSYNPVSWIKTAKRINELNPKTVIFRYYTPFLTPAYFFISILIKNNIKKIALIDNWIPHESFFLDNLFNKLFGIKMSGFITLSKNVSNQIKLNFNKPILTLFHPINQNLPLPISKINARKILKWPKERKTILFYGLIRKYKGLDLLIEAINIEPLKKTKIHLVIAGEFYESKEKYLKLITKNNLNKKVTIYDEFINNEMTKNLFCGSDAIIQTYRSSSQSGVSPLAYFYNTPVLVSNIDGLKDPILKDKSGIVSEKSTKEISRNILKLLNNLNYYTDNIKSVKSNYKWDKFVYELEKFISNL